MGVTVVHDQWLESARDLLKDTMLSAMHTDPYLVSRIGIFLELAPRPLGDASAKDPRDSPSKTTTKGSKK